MPRLPTSFDDLDIPERTADWRSWTRDAPIYLVGYRAQEIAIRWSATALTVMLSVMLPRSPDTDAFWQAFRRYAGLDHDNYVVGSFGDSPEMATELADLVIAGIKRATASLVHDYGAGREPIPKPGDFVMMLDGEGRPRFIWRTTEVTIKPLSQVDEAFAWDEGEGDRTREWWLDAHRRHFRSASDARTARYRRRDPHSVRALRGRMAA